MPPELELLMRFLEVQRRLRQRTTSTVLRAFDELEDYRDEDADRFVSAVAPVVAGAQQQIGSLTLAMVSRLVGMLAGVPPVVPSLQVGTVNRLRGVSPQEEWRRPFVQMRTELSAGASFQQARESARRRAESLADTDMQLAKTHTARNYMRSQERVVGYRRVLTGDENCGMCVIASTQRYRKEQLMPIHPGCDCAVAPIVGTRDPGRTINSAMVAEGAEPSAQTASGVGVYEPGGTLDSGDLLESVHKAVRERFGRAARGGRSIDYRKVLTTHEHGELGPVLAVSGQRFTGADEVPE